MLSCPSIIVPLLEFWMSVFGCFLLFSCAVVFVLGISRTGIFDGTCSFPSVLSEDLLFTFGVVVLKLEKLQGGMKA